MTTDQLAAYYANLLIFQYLQKPKAYAQVKSSVLPLLMDKLPSKVQDAFNIVDAVGAQLDVLGKYVGVSRTGLTLNGLVRLEDDDYRKLIRLVVIKNNSGSSLSDIQSLLAANFPGEILVSDNQTMGLNYVLLESLGTSDLLEILVTGSYMPAPMGVQTSVTIVPSHQYPFFGFTTYAGDISPVSPFNSYALYSMNAPWLSYST